MPETLHNPAFQTDAELRTDAELDLRGGFEGAPSIAALADALRGLASDFETPAADGWYLAGPVKGGWAHMARGGHDA